MVTAVVLLSDGPIPACAGEPQTAKLSRGGRGVYPPRVRGNHGLACAWCGESRSIPACAGEPRNGHVLRPTSVGLSPRVRGNRMPVMVRPPRSRSIPACAGEPRKQARTADISEVYPRVCGGTLRADSITGGCKGLSPRVRGNLLDLCDVLFYVRSIPACAGEPGSTSATLALRRVYPRVCGGTPSVGVSG